MKENGRRHPPHTPPSPPTSQSTLPSHLTLPHLGMLNVICWREEGGEGECEVGGEGECEVGGEGECEVEGRGDCKRELDYTYIVMIISSDWHQCCLVPRPN